MSVADALNNRSIAESVCENNKMQIINQRNNHVADILNGLETNKFPHVYNKVMEQIYKKNSH